LQERIARGYTPRVSQGLINFLVSRLGTIPGFFETHSFQDLMQRILWSRDKVIKDLFFFRGFTPRKLVELAEKIHLEKGRTSPDLIAIFRKFGLSGQKGRYLASYSRFDSIRKSKLK
jgi:hypothetical protein